MIFLWGLETEVKRRCDKEEFRFGITYCHEKYESLGLGYPFPHYI